MAVGIASGLPAAEVFRRTVDTGALRSTLRQIHARFLEFRLFFDEPRLIWRAQKALIRANFRLCLLFLQPALILALPMAWLMFQLDTVYGRAPLGVGEPSVVTAQLDAGSPSAALEAPAGINVETSPLHIASERRIVWRIRPLRPVTGLLRFTLNGVLFTKAIAAGSGNIFLLRRRENSLWAFLLHPEEPRLPAGGVAWLEVDYPGRSRWWMVWFLAAFSATTFVLARK